MAINETELWICDEDNMMRMASAWVEPEGTICPQCKKQMQRIFFTRVGHFYPNLPGGILESLSVDTYNLEHWGTLIDVQLGRVRQLPGIPDKWAIREMGLCLNKRGKWEIEPIPSSRTAAFLKRCRWNTAEEAYEFWAKNNTKSRFEHYRIEQEAKK